MLITFRVLTVKNAFSVFCECIGITNNRHLTDKHMYHIINPVMGNYQFMKLTRISHFC